MGTVYAQHQGGPKTGRQRKTAWPRADAALVGCGMRGQCRVASPMQPIERAAQSRAWRN